MVNSIAPCLFLLACKLASAAAIPELESCSVALDRGDFKEAAKAAQAFLVVHPASVPARVLLARAHMGRNDPTAALKELHEALRRDQNSVDALYYLAKLTAVLSGQEFVALAQMAPDSARVHQIRAEALDAHGDNAGAEREYFAALERRPATPSVMNAIGDLKRHSEQYRAALAWYEKVLARDSGNYDALYGAGVCRLLSREPAEALALFRRALKAEPSSLAAKMALGETLLVTGNATAAVSLLQEAAKADSGVKRLQYLLARAYQATGRQDEAGRAFQRYRDLAGDEPPPTLIRGARQQ